jgi:hypothetical protein
MLPRRIAHDAPDAERRRWRLVRLDTHVEVEGEILSADCDTGVCTIKKADGTAADHNFGPDGIAIVGR